MHYFGGKSRIATRVAAIINDFSPVNYYEPFCGGLWVTQYVQAQTYFLSDANPALITLYQHMLNGWIPPTRVTEEEYQHYRVTRNPSDPMTAFVGIGCAFTGKLWGGYARDNRGTNYAHAAHTSLLKKFKALRGKNIRFECCSFDKLYIPPQSVVYCDPPYGGTKNNHYFDGVTDDLWDTMRVWSNTSVNIVSEYNAPPDYTCIEEFRTHTEVRSGSGREPRIEKVYMKL